MTHPATSLGPERAQGSWLRYAVRWLVRMLALVGLLVVLVTVTPVVNWWAGKLAGRWTDPGGDVLIVLGGSGTRSGMIGFDSYLRSQYAIEAYRSGGFSLILVCGGGNPPTALAMRNFLVSQGIPAAAVRMETESRSTRENALDAKQALAGVPGRKVLLTSDYHMYRAYRTFLRAGVEVEPRPLPDARKRAASLRGRWPAFLDLMVESVKIVYYKARGWM